MQGIVPEISGPCPDKKISELCVSSVKIDATLYSNKLFAECQIHHFSANIISLLKSGLNRLSNSLQTFKEGKPN